MTITQGDHVIDRRTGERMRFSKLTKHNWLGTVATCIRPGAKGTVGRIKIVPLGQLRKVKRWTKRRSPSMSSGIVGDTQIPPS